MKKKIILFFIFQLFISVILANDYSNSAQASAISARRFAGETYSAALKRNLPLHNFTLFRSFNLQEMEVRSVINSVTSPDQINITSVPEVKTEAVASEMHHKLRDVRAWTWNEMQGFPRRLNWIFPEDGCYLRANLMVEKLKEWGYVKPKQIFAFGELSFDSPYEKMDWWYHVAPIVRIGTQAYVLDPALDFLRPLLLEDWLKKISENLQNIQVALCESGAVSPDDSCDSGDSNWDKSDRDATLQDFLGSEWTGLESILGKKPNDILGDRPPWLTP